MIVNGQPRGIMNFDQLPTGPWGFVTGMDIHSSGYAVIRTDVGGAYGKQLNTADPWIQLFTMSNLPAGYFGIEATQQNYAQTSFGCYEIVIAPSDVNRMYANVRGYTLKSIDKGLTWTMTALPGKTVWENGVASRLCGKKMAVDPRNPDILLVGFDTSLWRTADGGASWAEIIDVTDPSIASSPVLVAFNAASAADGLGNTTEVYAGSPGVGVFRSTTNGVGFTITASTPTTIKNMRCDHLGNLYLCDDTTTIKRCTAGVWSNLTACLTEAFNIVIDPASVSTGTSTLIMIRAAGLYPCVSTDGGATWGSPRYGPTSADVITTADDVPALVGGFLHCAGTEWHPTEPLIYATTGIAVVKTPPFAAAASLVPWESESGGIEELVGKFGLSPPGGDFIGGFMDRPFFKYSSMAVFPDHYSCGDAGVTHGWALDYVFNDPTSIVGLANYNALEGSGYSNDGGNTFTLFATSPSASDGGSIAVGPENIIIACPANNGWPRRTTDRGVAWADVVLPGVTYVSGETGFGFSSFSNNVHIITNDKATVDGLTFYLYNYGPTGNEGWAGLYKTIDGGAVWTKTFEGVLSPFATYHQKLKSVWTNEGHLFFTGAGVGAALDPNPGGTLFKYSTDGGVTWAEVTDAGGVSRFREVSDFSFGKPMRGSSYPSIWAMGWWNGSGSYDYGLWVSFDNKQSWTKVADYPLDNPDSISAICADKNIFGCCYVLFGGTGGAFGRFEHKLSLVG